jgi:hypothetical protein
MIKDIIMRIIRAVVGQNLPFVAQNV